MSQNNRTIFYIGLVFAVAGLACLLWFYVKVSNVSYRKSGLQSASAIASQNVLINATTTIPGTQVANSDIRFEIVKDLVGQEKGLGGRSTIPDNYGMLFVFPNDGSYGFWMKDMLTSIDMIWISDNGTILGITSNVAPSTYPNVFYPPTPVHFVIETKVGLAIEKKWKTGTRITLPQSALLPD